VRYDVFRRIDAVPEANLQSGSRLETLSVDSRDAAKGPASVLLAGWDAVASLGHTKKESTASSYRH
jgi:hypothetical protein